MNKTEDFVNRYCGVLAEIQGDANHLHAGISGAACGPFKTYGKRAFTPEVPPQVLRGGRLVPLTGRADNGLRLTDAEVETFPSVL